MSIPYDDIIGPFMIVAILNGVMCGITLTQVFTYYTTTFDDKKIFVYSVALLTFIDILHTIMSSYTVYHWCVTNFGNPAVLIQSPWSFTYECGLTGIATIIVQSFFAYRVYCVSSRKILLPAIIFALSMVSFGFALGATIEIIHLNGDFTKFTVWTYGVVLWLAPAAMADVLITASLIFYLRRNKDQLQQANSIIDTIIRNTVETNGLSMTVCLIATFVFSFGPGTWHVLPQILLQKLYFNSYLVSLNSRKTLAARIQAKQTSGARFDESGFETSKCSPGFSPDRSIAKRFPADSVVPIHVSITETRTSMDEKSGINESGSQRPAKSNDVELNAMSPACDPSW